MSDETKPIAAHGEQEAVMDSDDIMNKDLDDLDRLIICALAGMGVPSLRKETIAKSRADEETCLANSPLTGTTHSVADQTCQPAADAGALMDQYRACQQVEEWHWTCEFRKSKKEIGRGGQGVVYLIESVDPFFASRALKVLSPKPYGDAQAYRQDMERMKSVASVVEQICHGNLIQVDRFESHGGSYYIVMRLIDGFDVRYLLQPKIVEKLLESVSSVSAERWAELTNVVFAPWGAEQRALTPGVAVNIIENCLRGVSALHDKGIVHCDIKPSNVMLANDGNIRLIDIGSAYEVGSRPQHFSWTPRYAPPEVLEGGDWTPRGDLASLGYVLIEMLSGRPDVLIESASGRPESFGQFAGSDSEDSVSALDQPTRNALAEAKRWLPSRLNDLIPYDARRSSRLKELCKKLIHPDPAERFPDARKAIFGPAGTHRFLRELVNANLDAHWIQVMECWVKDMKNASSLAIDNVQ